MDSDSVVLHAAAKLRGVVLCLAVLLTGLCYSFRLTSFMHAKDAVLVVCVLAMALSAALSGRASWRGWAAFLPLWLLAGYGLGVHLWLRPCVLRSEVFLEVFRWMGVLLAGALSYDLFLDKAWRRRVTDAIVVTAAVTAVLALLQYGGLAGALFPTFGGTAHRVYSVFGNADLLGGYLAVAFPLVVHRATARGRRRWPWWLVLGLVAPALLVSGSRSAWLAAAVGTVVVLPHPRRCFRTAGGLGLAVVAMVVVTALVAPQATLQRAGNTFSSADQGGRLRLWFWDGSLRMARDHWVLGVGPGNYAYWSPKYLGEALHAPGGQAHAHNELHTLHAHADPVELLDECGVVGVLLVVWMAVRLMRCRGVEWGGLAALLVFASMNFPFASAPHILAAVLLAGMLLARRDGQLMTHARGSSRTAGILALALALMVCVATLWGVVGPSYRLRRAEDAHLAGRPCLEFYEAAVRGPWALAVAHEKYGIAFLEAGMFPEAEAQYRRALEGLDTGAVHLALGALSARRGDDGEARRSLTLCLGRWPSNADAWRLLMRASPEAHHGALMEDAERWLSPEDAARLVDGAASTTVRGE
jgi:O-Antigen ligase